MMDKSAYRLDVQGLRAVAVLAVMVFHYDGTLLPGGYIGVVYQRTFRVRAILSIGLVLVTVGLAEPAFVLLFGQPWRLPGTMAVWLVPLFALRFIACPLSYTFFLAQKQNVDLIWQGALLAMVVSVLYGFASYRTTLIAYSYGYAGMYVVYLVLSRRYGGRPLVPAQ